MSRVLAGVHSFIYTLLAFPRAWRFMWHHRLWRGLRDYGWVARGLLIIAVLVGLYMISEAIDFYGAHSDDTVHALFMTPDSLFVRWVTDAYESFSDGGLKWVILVLLEVVIYHFMRRSIAIILGREVEDQHTFKPFLTAQWRMIIVSTIAFTLESVITGVSEGLLPSVVYGPVSLGVSATFLGLVIADNYNEQFSLTVEQSFRHLFRNYIGICLGLGLPLFLMLQVPLLGAVIGPLVTSVTAAIVLRELSDLHIVGYQMSEKEREKADRKAAKKAKKIAKQEERLRRKTSRV